MKQRSLLILAAAALLFASCGNKGGKSGLMVPKDAAVVVHINSASLSSKISWAEIKNTAWFQQMRSHSESNDSLSQRILDDPSSSGIDTKSDFVMFIRKHGRGSYMVVEGSLTNEATYQQLIAEMHKNEPKEIKKAGDFSYMVPDDKSVVLWSKTRFAMISNANMAANPMSAGMMGGPRGRSANAEFSTDSLLVFGQQALSLEGGQNLDSDSRFADLVKDGSDMHVWFNAEHYYGDMSQLKRLAPMVKIEALFKGNISTISLNFDNGKITAKTRHYPGEEMRKIASNNKPSNVSADMINRIPSSDVVAVVAFNYSPSGLKETLKVLGVDALADMYLSQMNYSVDEFVKANNGGMLLAVSDPKINMDTLKMGGTTEVRPSKPGANILFATSVKDQASFEKLVTLIWDASKQMMGKMGKGGDPDEGSGAPGFPGIHYKVANNWFAISNSADHTEKFLAGGNSNLPFVSKISGHPMGLYVDLQRIIKLAGSMGRDSSAGKALYEASLSMWQDVTGFGGDFNGDYSDGQFEINLVDKSTNSLKQLNQYIDKISAVYSQMKKDRGGWDMGKDSLKMSPRVGTDN